MITITESAQSKIKEVLEDETTDTRLRMYKDLVFLLAIQRHRPHAVAVVLSLHTN